MSSGPALIIFAALVLDACLGEPRRFHPLVGCGRMARALDEIVIFNHAGITA